VIGFDLSAAFDTVGREDLLPMTLGIGGKALKWFRCYLTNAKQRVVWDGQMSDIVDVEYRVRQGSRLGPVLYLLHVFDLPLALEIRESDGNSTYANDAAVWVIAEDIEEAQRELQQLANAMAKFTRDNDLALNGAKTQVMIGSAKDKDISNIIIHVDGAEVKPSNTFELLGVTFDQRFMVRLCCTNLSKEAKFRDGCVARLAQHLPRGKLLRQLGSGLLMANWRTASLSWHSQGCLGQQSQSRRRWLPSRLPSTTWPGPSAATRGRIISPSRTCLSRPSLCC
jgi:hypothetical protein